jgi:hypothetical protein
MSKSGFTTQNSSGALLTIAPTGLSSIGTPISITPVAGQDLTVNVSGAGELAVVQSSTGGATNPLTRLENTNATGSVAMEVYKNKPTAVVAGDVLFNQSVYGKDATNAKQEYTRITHTIRDGAAGGEDGSIEMACFTGGAVSTFLQINGIENEVNCLKNLDMGGNNIKLRLGRFYHQRADNFINTITNIETLAFTDGAIRKNTVCWIVIKIVFRSEADAF